MEHGRWTLEKSGRSKRMDIEKREDGDRPFLDLLIPLPILCFSSPFPERSESDNLYLVFASASASVSVCVSVTCTWRTERCIFHFAKHRIDDGRRLLQVVSPLGQGKSWQVQHMSRDRHADAPFNICVHSGPLPLVPFSQLHSSIPLPSPIFTKFHMHQSPWKVLQVSS